MQQFGMRTIHISAPPLIFLRTIFYLFFRKKLFLGILSMWWVYPSDGCSQWCIWPRDALDQVMHLVSWFIFQGWKGLALLAMWCVHVTFVFRGIFVYTFINYFWLSSIIFELAFMKYKTGKRVWNLRACELPRMYRISGQGQSNAVLHPLGPNRFSHRDRSTSWSRNFIPKCPILRRNEFGNLSICIY